MASRILSRYLILMSIIALLGIGVILSVFYGQYRWVTSGMVSSSVEHHGAALSGSFERRARGQRQQIPNKAGPTLRPQLGQRHVLPAEPNGHAPNGAQRDIAGIVSKNGRVLGMMPHPERAIEPALGGSDGARLFSGLAAGL